MLFKITSELKENIGIIDASFNFDTIKTDIKWAERKYIKPVLGAEYALLEADYQSNATISNDAVDITSMAAKYQTLLPYVQEALAHFAYAKWSHGGHTTISDRGTTKRSTESESMVWQWQLKDLQDNHLLRHGFDALDWLLEYLETNKATYTDWAGDTSAYTINKKYFINNIDQFEEYYNLQGSRRAFKALFPIMRHVEEFTITEHIGETFYNTLKTAIANASITGDNLTVVQNYIRPAVAYLTIAQAADQHAAFINQEGIFIFNIESGEGNNKTQLYSEEAIKRVKTKAEENGKAWLKKLSDYLNANASDSKFSDYFDSDLYVSPTATTDPTVLRNNDTGLETPKKTFRAF